MGPTQNPDSVSYKLTNEDYENIWLRIKNKTRMQVYITYGGVAAMVTIIAFLFTQNLLTYSKEYVSHSIGDYIKGDNFKQQIKATFQDQFTIVDKKLKLIDDGLEKLEIYKSAPMNISDHGFTLVDQKGDYIIVEYGTGSSHNFKFKSKFKQPPIVTATVISSFWSGNNMRERTPSVSSITKDGFNMTISSILPFEIKWIAIGK